MVTKAEEKQQFRRCEKLQSLLGLFFAMLAAVFCALMGFLVKYLKEASVDQLLLLRFSLQYLFTLPVMQWNGKAFIEHKPERNVYVAIVALCGTVTSYTYFLSFDYLSIGDAGAIAWNSVALVGIFACICLKEQCGFFEILFSTTALVGLLLITRPTFIFGLQTDGHGETNRPLGIILAVTSMVSNTIYIVALRKLGEGVHFSISLLYHALSTIIASLLSLHFKNAFVIPCPSDGIYMLSSSVLGLLYILFTVLALQRESAGPVTIVSTSQVAITFLLEYFFLSVVPSAFSVVGATLVIASTIGLTTVNMRRRSG